MVTLPDVVVHADWGTNPKTRWMACAQRGHDGSYRARAPQKVGDPQTLLRCLRGEFGVHACVLVGFDFPIGLPARYAALVQVSDFLSFLREVPDGRWVDFFSVADRADQISLYRPFYPNRPMGKGEARLVDMTERLGLDKEAMRRCCEQGYSGRRAAAPLFWTIGAQQVGKAAISGWRDVINPALRDIDLNVAIWPFSGRLFDLFQPGRIIIAETYPAEFYSHLGVTFHPQEGRKYGKRVWQDREAKAQHLIDSADAMGVTLSPELPQQIRSGFGRTASGEDPFDAFVGLLGMLRVVLKQQPPGDPTEDQLKRIEGWILGQSLAAQDSLSRRKS